MIGPGFAQAAAGEMFRGCLPAALVVCAVLVGIGVLIGWVFF